MKRFTPFVFVIVILVLALAALGVGYGYWSDTLDVNGNVTTGTFNVDIVAQTALSNDCGGSVTGDTLSFSFLNIAPGYTCTQNFDLNNTGSLGAIINNPIVWNYDTDTDGTSTPATWITLDCAAGNTVASLAAKSCQLVFTMDSLADQATYEGKNLSFDVAMTLQQNP